MIEASNVAVTLDAFLLGNERQLKREAAKALGLGVSDIVRIELAKRSVDARKKNNVHFVCTFALELRPGVADKVSPVRGVNVRPYNPPDPLQAPSLAGASQQRPLVVGAGPAGLFAALYLAQAGLRPLLVERGGDVDERVRAVEAFASGGPLDCSTNVQFGEGGAGTFSDGKLTTGTKSPHIRHVLQAFVDCGAPHEILWQAKPHIGTDRLVDVVRTLRERIQELGGEVRFHTQLVDLRVERGAVVEASLACGASGCIERMPVGCVVLACGHSARDTFFLMRERGAVMERKPFSMGVRIEHPQKLINEIQYGRSARHKALGAADYKLAVHLPDGRGVYTFCMCPGGEVVAAASEEGGVCVNGMSRFARDGRNANSALLVEVRPDDIEGEDVLAGIELQRSCERAAYGAAMRAGGAPYSAPAQTVASFMGMEPPEHPVEPTYPRGTVSCDLHECLPPFVSAAIELSFAPLDKKMRGFFDPSAIMTAVEARSSSPVRIVRDETFQASFCADASRESSPTPSGLYPCGEGAGYAGGIMSAAVDGLRVAEAICARYSAHADSHDDAQQGAPSRKDSADLEDAVAALRRGRAVVLPTDTVYGLGVSVLHTPSPHVLFDIKQRDEGKPIAWLVSSPQALDEYGVGVCDAARRIARGFWPGQVTLVVKASDKVPSSFRSGDGTIALRMPSDAVALELCHRVGSPLATTSANVSGLPAVSDFDQLDERILSHAAAALRADSRTESSGVSSTVVDCTTDALRILRVGAVSPEEIRRVAFNGALSAE